MSFLAVLGKLLLQPKTFFTEKRECGWREPFYFFITTIIIYSIFNIILLFIYRAILSDAFILNTNNPVYLVFFLFNSILQWLEILILLGGLIILLFDVFRYNVDYLGVFKVLLFTHVLWLAFSLLSGTFLDILIYISSGLGIFSTVHGRFLFQFMFKVIGFSWIAHRTFIGVTTFFDMPYKKGIFFVGIPCIITLYYVLNPMTYIFYYFWYAP